MPPHARGLARECEAAGGIELLSAWFAGKAHRTHRHDTYAIGVTDAGMQVFDYRGASTAKRRGGTA